VQLKKKKLKMDGGEFMVSLGRIAFFFFFRKKGGVLIYIWDRIFSVMRLFGILPLIMDNAVFIFL